MAEREVLRDAVGVRSEERRVGKECNVECRGLKVENRFSG